jgi:hypothetical protein
MAVGEPTRYLERPREVDLERPAFSTASRASSFSVGQRVRLASVRDFTLPGSL